MNFLKDILILLLYFFLLCASATLAINYEGINSYVYIPALMGFFMFTTCAVKKIISIYEN